MSILCKFFLPQLVVGWMKSGHSLLTMPRPNEVTAGWIAFLQSLFLTWRTMVFAKNECIFEWYHHHQSNHFSPHPEETTIVSHHQVTSFSYFSTFPPHFY